MKQQEHKLWIARRDMFLKKHNYCMSCGDKYDLHVHHKCYQNGRAYWDYTDEYLETLCVKCHKAFHDRVPITKLYRVGSNMSVALTVMKLSVKGEALRRKAITSHYDFDMLINYYSKKYKSASEGTIKEIRFITGKTSVEIAEALTQRNVKVK